MAEIGKRVAAPLIDDDEQNVSRRRHC
jgi:hypothetical protein